MDKEDLLALVKSYATKPSQEFRPGIDEVPVSGAQITADDIAAVVSCVLDGWFTEGKISKQFENEIKSYTGTRHVSLCNSGSSASLLATTALAHTYKRRNVYTQPFIITCATGFPTTVYPIYQNGLVPLFIDSAGYKELNPDVNLILELLERRDVLGVAQAHTLGFPFRADLVRAKCDELGKFFVEDCADALGAKIGDKYVGQFGHASILSFFPAHQITSGEGGAVCTNDGRLHKLINSYRDWGRDCWCLPGKSNTCGKRFDWDFSSLPDGWDHKYTFTNLGYNLKMTEMQAALGLSQLSHFDIITRQINYALLLFLHLIAPGLLWVGWNDQKMTENDYWDYSPFGVPITVTTDKFSKQELVRFLESRKIRTRPVFGGNLTRQPAIRKMYYEQIGVLPNSDYIMENTFWIGCHPSLTRTQLDYVIESFHAFFREKGLI